VCLDPKGTPALTADTATVSDLDSRSRPMVRSRAIVRVECAWVSVLSVLLPGDGVSQREGNTQRERRDR
jgi:hypothetical protein